MKQQEKKEKRKQKNKHIEARVLTYDALKNFIIVKTHTELEFLESGIKYIIYFNTIY